MFPPKKNLSWCHDHLTEKSKIWKSFFINTQLPIRILISLLSTGLYIYSNLIGNEFFSYATLDFMNYALRRLWEPAQSGGKFLAWKRESRINKDTELRENRTSVWNKQTTKLRAKRKCCMECKEKRGKEPWEKYHVYILILNIQ